MLVRLEPQEAPGKLDQGVMIACGAGLSLAMIVKILRTMKTTEDGSPEEATAAVHLMCDLGLAVARLLFRDHCKGNEAEIPKVPGGCCLPQSFFRAISHRRTGKTLKRQFTVRSLRGLCSQEHGAVREQCAASFACQSEGVSAAKSQSAFKALRASEGILKCSDTCKALHIQHHNIL